MTGNTREMLNADDGFGSSEGPSPFKYSRDSTHGKQKEIGDSAPHDERIDKFPADVRHITDICSQLMKTCIKRSTDTETPRGSSIIDSMTQHKMEWAWYTRSQIQHSPGRFIFKYGQNSDNP